MEVALFVARTCKFEVVNPVPVIVIVLVRVFESAAIVLEPPIETAVTPVVGEGVGVGLGVPVPRIIASIIVGKFCARVLRLNNPKPWSYCAVLVLPLSHQKVAIPSSRATDV